MMRGGFCARGEIAAAEDEASHEKRDEDGGDEEGLGADAFEVLALGDEPDVMHRLCSPVLDGSVALSDLFDEDLFEGGLHDFEAGDAVPWRRLRRGVPARRRPSLRLISAWPP